jgi:hypothetical protein
MLKQCLIFVCFASGVLTADRFRRRLAGLAGPIAMEYRRKESAGEMVAEGRQPGLESSLRGRSTPVILGDHLYLQNTASKGKPSRSA